MLQHRVMSIENTVTSYRLMDAPQNKLPDIFIVECILRPDSSEKFSFCLRKNDAVLGWFKEATMADTVCGFLNFFDLLTEGAAGPSSFDRMIEFMDFLGSKAKANSSFSP